VLRAINKTSSPINIDSGDALMNEGGCPSHGLPLTLCRANVSRKSGDWNDDNFVVFDDDRDVGRIYRINAAAEIWFWGVSFQLTGRKSYGRVDSLDDAKVAFRAEYEAWLKDAGEGRNPARPLGRRLSGRRPRGCRTRAA
jgi:hypothetical protein